MTAVAPPERGPARRDVVLGAALLTAAGAAAVLRPRGDRTVLPDGTLERAVPMRVGPYRFAGTTGLIVPPRDEMANVIYDQVLTRIYVAEDQPPVMLLIAYGNAQNATLALHRPEVCYPAAGYTVADGQTMPLAGRPGGTATTLVAARGDRVEQIYFWTRIGATFPASRMAEKLAVLTANLRGLLPDGVLVRLSVRSTDTDAAVRQMMAFNAALIGSGDADERRLLLGTGAVA